MTGNQYYYGIILDWDVNTLAYGNKIFIIFMVYKKEQHSVDLMGTFIWGIFCVFLAFGRVHNHTTAFEDTFLFLLSQRLICIEHTDGQLGVDLAGLMHRSG